MAIAIAIKFEYMGGTSVTSDEIGKYMERTFSLDCPHMVLRQNVASAGQIYEGPGSVYQTKGGDLMFKLYSGGAPDYSTLARRLGPNAIRPGEIIPREEYFGLEATCLHGASWNGGFILPEVNQGVKHGPVVTGSVYELTKRTHDPYSKEPNAYLTLIFAVDFDFPGNRPIVTKTFLAGEEIGMSGDWTPAVFDAAGIEFQLRKKGSSVALSAQSKNATLPQHLDMRISEALEFTFFESERWVIRTVYENREQTTTLRPFPKEHITRTPRPPVGFRSHQTAEDVWRLFARYLEYVIPHPQAEWHPLSDNVHLAVTGDAAPLDSAMLALSVAVEGVLNTGFPKLATPSISLLEEIEAACKLVSDSGLSDSFKQRLLGSLGAMHTPRAKDRLQALVDAGALREELMKAWARIRNSTVHGGDLDPAEIRKMFRDYQSILTLFNELIFLVVGYAGQYTDYSTGGCPLRDYNKTRKDIEESVPGGCG